MLVSITGLKVEKNAHHARDPLPEPSVNLVIFKALYPES